MYHSIVNGLSILINNIGTKPFGVGSGAGIDNDIIAGLFIKKVGTVGNVNQLGLERKGGRGRKYAVPKYILFVITEFYIVLKGNSIQYFFEFNTFLFVLPKRIGGEKKKQLNSKKCRMFNLIQTLI
ncbi:hypothetical protein HYN59_00625 [Flavobacterium album]|uniref:Uncharacterized protein n=1 Tax=Flavobacterium album TaxID=2175091 RepID=A0A2S1QTF4_9FLAO|nr:hypothetical protein HYN59_00625 [Flavobacterium album]